MPDDYTADIHTSGSLAVGGSVTGAIESAYDQDWFAVELVAGRTYRFDLQGSPDGHGTLADTFLRAIYDSEGRYQSGSYNDDHDGGRDSRVTWTAPASGTYYVRASGDRDETGSYTLSVTDLTPQPETPVTPPDPDAPRSGATDLGDITELDAVQFPRHALDGGADAVDYFRFTLSEAQAVGLGLRQLDHDADLSLEAEDGTVIATSANAGTANEWIEQTLLAGTYYVRVEAQAAGANAYVLRYGVSAPDADEVARLESLDAPDVDEPLVSLQQQTVLETVSEPEGEDLPAGTGTTGRVLVGGSATGNIGTAYDQDWFAVDLEAGRRYRFDLEGSRTDDGTLRDPYLRGLYDADGTLIARTTNDDGGAGLNSRVEFTPSAAGTYYVAAGAYGDRQGTYTLSVAAVTVTPVTDSVTDDYVAGTDTSGTVAVGGPATGEIEFNGDRDWFAVTLEANKTYRFDLEGSRIDGGTLSDPYLRGIHDANGIRIAGTADNNSGEGASSRVDFTPRAGGTYYVAAGAYGDRQGTYTLSVTEFTLEYGDLPADTSTPYTVAVGGSVTGEIETWSDEDWFAVTLEADKTYRVNLEGSGTDGGTLPYPRLRGIHDADGNLIAGTTDNGGRVGWNSRVDFVPEAAGTYYVAAGASGGLRGTYRLSVTELPDDYTAGTGTTGMVAVGGSATGEIEFDGDPDWFAVTLEADKTYRVDLKGSPTDHGTLGNPYLRGIHDADGNLIAGTTDNNSGEGANSQVYFTPRAAGTYYVAAAGAYYVAPGGSLGLQGTYTVSVTHVDDYAGPTDDYTAGTDTTGEVAVGGSATGEIESDVDQDWFAVTLEADTTYRFDLEGSRTDDGTLRDPYLRGLYDADGNQIAGTTNNDGGTGRNSRVHFRPSAAGTYYVAAGAHREEQGTYTLSVNGLSDRFADYAADYPADTSTPGTVTVGGSAAGLVGFRGDRDWFAVDLEAGTTYRVDLEGVWTNGGTMWDPYLYGIHDADGTLIAGTKNDDGGSGYPHLTDTIANGRVYFTPSEDGTYYVAAGGYQSSRGTYTLPVAEAPQGSPDDYAAEPDTTGRVTVGGSATGEIEFRADRDWFAVDLEAGTTYRVDLEGWSADRGSLANPYLAGIYAAKNDRIAGTTDGNGGGGWNSRVYFTPSEDGTYYVAAAAHTSRQLGTYTLSVTAVTDDYSADVHTTGTVAVGGSVAGEIESDRDRDWFAVDLEAGTTYRVDLEGLATWDGTLGDPYLRGIHDANGIRIAGTTDDNGGTGANGRVTFTPSEDGTYYVAAGANASYQLGTYTLSVDDAVDAL